ncbi:MAG: hypothetical protein KVP17_001224 [Porospora cf. gigantea B]|uniref:uncharacterized protein n=1 Tax=Porospora cf. gigantea B TaxID=2853592 RepID=UPI00357184BE|nr:MAG: hypothetical protein KVP17_001224 [Porospora cf. gigantea B]
MKLWKLRISSVSSLKLLGSSLAGATAGGILVEPSSQDTATPQGTEHCISATGYPTEHAATAGGILVEDTVTSQGIEHCISATDYQEASCMDFWMNTVYRTEDAHPALRALVPPNELLEFYNEGVPLSIKQKSFLFTCVVGLGPTILTPQNPKLRQLRMLPPRSPDGAPPVFDRMTLERLSAFHAVDVVHRKSLAVSDVSLFRHLTSADRMQFLRELSSPVCVREMETSRWFYLDVAKEAMTFSLHQLQITALVDMSMLLQLPWKSQAVDVGTIVVSLTMIFLSMDGASEADRRVVYFLVQHTFQALRCQIFSDDFHFSPPEFRRQLCPRFSRSIQAGWARFIGQWPSPTLKHAFSAETLMLLGLWPLLLNPFKLSGRRWSEMEDQEPFLVYVGHESLESSPFSLDPDFCVWPVDTGPESSQARHLTALRMHVTTAFGALPPGPSDRPPLARSPAVTTSSLTPQEDCDLESTFDLVSQGEKNLLQGITWPEDDPGLRAKLGLRAKVSLAVCCGLIKGYPLQTKVRAATDRLLSEICDDSILVTLAKLCPQCFCAQTHRALPSRTEALRVFSQFSVPTAKQIIRKKLLSPEVEEEVLVVAESLRNSAPIYARTVAVDYCQQDHIQSDSATDDPQITTCSQSTTEAHLVHPERPSEATQQRHLPTSQSRQSTHKTYSTGASRTVATAAATTHVYVAAGAAAEATDECDDMPTERRG